MLRMAAEQSNAAATAPTVARLVSLDAYRGFVMLAMVSHSFGLPAVARELANRQDQHLAFWQQLAYQFDHVPWQGCVFWDLIQPSFMFMVGTAMAFSCAARRAKGQSYGLMALHAAWRAVALILLGVFLRTEIRPDPDNPGGIPLTNFTFVDVVSQIGFGYFFLFLLWGRRQWVLMLVALAILFSYWALFAAYPLPEPGFDYEKVGVPADWEYNYPHVPPDADFQAHWNKNTNPASDFDVWFLNLFPRTKRFEFNSGGYATLNFIPSLVTMIFGLMAGQMLLGPASYLKPRDELPHVQREAHVRASKEKFGLLLLGGLAGLVIGYLLHISGVCPAVKRIWTPTWTIYSTGWTLIMLAAFYGIIELANFRWWAFPLAVVGMNSIAIYVLDKLTREWIIDRLQVHLGGRIFTLWGLVDSAFAPLVQSLIVMALLWLVMYWMYRRKIFLKI
jgi:heparan-alpha-glucosaminide N-acetyltransferase